MQTNSGQKRGRLLYNPLAELDRSQVQVRGPINSPKPKGLPSAKSSGQRAKPKKK